jgi:hypothetical protein
MIKGLYDSIKERVRILFTSGKDSAWRKGWTNPRRDPPPRVFVSRERLRRVLGLANPSRGPLPEVFVNQESDRERRKREWCRRFNVRQRWIVPAKSPESIYLKAVKPRKRA